MNKSAGRIVRFLVVVVLVAVPIVALNQAGIGREEIRGFVEQLGIWAPLGLFALRFTSVVIPALPGTAYSVLAGGLLGFGPGLAVVCLADFLSCSVSFWLASRFGRSFAARMVGDRWMARVDRFSQRQLERNFFLMTAFLMTGFFDFVAYGLGIAKAPWRKFLPALALSIALSNPPIVALGAGIFARGKLLLVGALLGAFGLALLTGWLRRSPVALAEGAEEEVRRD